MQQAKPRRTAVSRTLIPIAAGLILGALLLWLGLCLQTQQALADISSGVLIDPGHGGEDVGAVAPGSGVHEAELNLAVSLALQEELKSRGVQAVELTRNNQEALGPTKEEDMQERGRMIGSTQAAVLVSVHMNSFPADSAVKGPQVFYQNGDADSAALAQAIQQRLNDAVKTDRRIAPKDLFVLRSAKVPAVLVECGFLTNPDEDRLLRQEDYQRMIAKAIADGIGDVCR